MRLFPSLFQFPKRLNALSLNPRDLFIFNRLCVLPLDLTPLRLFSEFIFYFRVYFVFLNALTPREFIFRFIFYFSSNLRLFPCSFYFPILFFIFLVCSFFNPFFSCFGIRTLNPENSTHSSHTHRLDASATAQNNALKN